MKIGLVRSLREAWAYSFGVQLNEARQANEEALDIWKALGNLPIAADAISVKMGSLRFAGEYEDLLATGSEAVHLSQWIGNALHHYMALLLMGETHCVQVRLGQAFSSLDREAPFSFATVPLMVADAHLQLALGNPEGALERTGDVIHQLNQAGGRFYLAELLWLQGRARLVLENTRRAREALMEAKAVAEDTGERTILWQILATLSDLERTNGNQPEAEKLRCQAREIVNYIAENAGADALRDSFLAQPAVARVLTESKKKIPNYLA